MAEVASSSGGLENTEYRKTESGSDVSSIDTQKAPLGEAKKKAGISKVSTAAAKSKNDSKGTNKIEKARSTKPTKMSPPLTTSTHASPLGATKVQRAKSTDSRSLVGTPSGAVTKDASTKAKQNATPQSKPVSVGTPLTAKKSTEKPTENGSKPLKTPGKVQKPVSAPQPARPTKSTALVKQEAKKSPSQDKIESQKDKQEPFKAAPKSSSSVATNQTVSAVKKSADGKSAMGASEANEKLASKSVPSKGTSPSTPSGSKGIAEKLAPVNKAQQAGGSGSRNPTTTKVTSTPKKVESFKTAPATDKRSAAKSTAVSKAKSPLVSKSKKESLPKKAEEKKSQAANKTVANDKKISDAIQHAPDSVNDGVPDTVQVLYDRTEETANLDPEEISGELDEPNELSVPHASQVPSPSGDSLSVVQAMTVEEESSAEVGEATEDQASASMETIGSKHPEGIDEASTNDDYAPIVSDEDTDKNNHDQDANDSSNECESTSYKCEENLEVASYQEHQHVEEIQSPGDTHFPGEVHQDGDSTKPSKQTENIPIEVERQEAQEESDCNAIRGNNELNVEQLSVEGERIDVAGSDTSDEKDACGFDEEVATVPEGNRSVVSKVTSCLEEIPNRNNACECERESGSSQEEDAAEVQISILEDICENKQPHEEASAACQEEISPEVAASNTSLEDVRDEKNTHEHEEELAACQEAYECKDASALHQEDDSADELNDVTCPVDSSDHAGAYERNEDSATCQEHQSPGGSSVSTCVEEDLSPCHQVADVEAAESHTEAQADNVSNESLFNEELEERDEVVSVQMSMAESITLMDDKEIYDDYKNMTSNLEQNEHVSEQTTETPTPDHADLNIPPGQPDGIEICSPCEIIEDHEGACEAKHELGVQCSGFELEEAEVNEGYQHPDGHEFCEQGKLSMRLEDASISVDAFDEDGTIVPNSCSSISEENLHDRTDAPHDGEYSHKNSMNQKSSLISHVLQEESCEKEGDCEPQIQDTNSIETNTIEVHAECPTDVSQQPGVDEHGGEELSIELRPTEEASDDQVAPDDGIALSHLDEHDQESGSMVCQTELRSEGKDRDLDNDAASEYATQGLLASSVEAGLQGHESVREFYECSANQEHDQLSEETSVKGIDARNICAEVGLTQSQKADDIVLSTFTIEDKMAVVKEFAEFDKHDNGQVSDINDDEVGNVSYSNAEVVGNFGDVTEPSHVCVNRHESNFNETNKATSLSEYSHDSNNFTRSDAESPAASPVRANRSKSDLEPSHERLDIAYDSTTPLSDIGIELIPGSTVVQFKSNDVCDMNVCDEDDGRRARLDFASSSSLAKSGKEPEDPMHSSDACQGQIGHEVCASTKSPGDQVDVPDEEGRPLHESKDDDSAFKVNGSYLDHKSDLDLQMEPDAMSWMASERIDLQDDKESFTEKIECAALDEYGAPYKQQKFSGDEVSLENSSSNIKDLAPNPEQSVDEKVFSHKPLNENVKEFADHNTAVDGFHFTGSEGCDFEAQLDIHTKFYEDRQQLQESYKEQITEIQSICCAMDPHATDVAVASVLIASNAEPSTEHYLINDADAEDVAEVHTDVSEILAMADAAGFALECEDEEANLFHGASKNLEARKDCELPGLVDEYASKDLSDLNEVKKVYLNDEFGESIASDHVDLSKEALNHGPFQEQWRVEGKLSSQEEGIITDDFSDSCCHATGNEKDLQANDKYCETKDEVAWFSTGLENPEDAIAFPSVVGDKSFDYASRFSITSQEEDDFKDSGQGASSSDSLGVRSADVELLSSSEVDDGIIIDADAGTEVGTEAHRVDGLYKMGSFGGPTIVADVSSDSDIEEDDNDPAECQDQCMDDHHKYAQGFNWSATPCYSSKHNAEEDLDGTSAVRDDCVESSAHDPFGQINAVHMEIPYDSPFHGMEEHGSRLDAMDEQTDY